ncbi:MAG: hypothetical protein KDK37_15755 [Leptospiraceae bacterium]|nr:hypothetical protein [Leptospiraceae bacterium]
MARPKKGEIRTSDTVTFTMTIPRELAEAIEEIAQEEMRSRSNQIQWILQQEVERKKKAKGEN